MADLRDDFDRADTADIAGSEATVSGVGQGWTWDRVDLHGSGVIGISSNYARVTSNVSPAQTLYLASSPLSSSDHTVQWLSNFSSDSNRFTGCTLRSNGVDAAYVWSTNLGTSTLYKVVGGVVTSIKSMTFGDMVYPNTCLLKATIQGSLMTFEQWDQTGATLLHSDTATDTSITTGQFVGINGWSTPDATRGWQWWEATAIASGIPGGVLGALVQDGDL